MKTEVLGGGRLLGATPQVPEGLDAYLATGGFSTGPSPDRLLQWVEAIRLTGRGGANFPLAAKLRAVRDRPGAKVVVANGAEGEPGSIKDRHLMRFRPFLVLDGLCRAAAIVNAGSGYVYVTDPIAAQQLRQALRDWWLPISVGIVEGPATYVAGEESAVVRFLNGGPALPTAKPPRPFERGVADEPTLVSNVETLAHLALIAAGRPAAGHMLITVSGGGTKPSLREVAIGSTLRSVLGGGLRITGALAGGMFGGLVGSEVLDLPLDQATFRAAGSGLGSGAIHVFNQLSCPVSVAADALSFLAAESSRQCGVCVSGTRSLAETLAAIAQGHGSTADIERLTRWSETLVGRGACGLLDAAARITASLLRLRPAFPHYCAQCLSAPPSLGARLTVALPELGTPIRRTEGALS
ncbi:NADH-ubiquinone oxidoreductase-F iron-sulfur binding region domain-containing protein [Catelliglobosispora koreensis]|uniref:NADH-ubiquinone oxidoreductase-F iron-sulfur binding region domain-containing protein n=1 Tax=Catelliglobosispora koreensis TaxID=129052 RepID=UPI0003663F28|nr:NADH-ubiquinone oxidoreductase-F iron-sulfur binding region domain-containing protein [Catelliglobosispora koreensis]